MALQGTFALLCSLAVLSSSAAQDETSLLNCTSQTQLLERLSEDLNATGLTDLTACDGSLTHTWTTQKTAALLLSMRKVTGILHKHLLQECHGAEPKKCPEAEVPKNGGLACVTVDNRRYCKPLCEHGYDFAFLRRSRPYDECSNDTGFKWQSQYIGGNKLAVCHESTFPVSGANTAYFPEDQDCLKTKSMDQLQSTVIEDLTTELKDRGVQGAPQSACLVCG